MLKLLFSTSLEETFQQFDSYQQQQNKYWDSFVLQKSCSARDSGYVQCDNSRNCVRKELFCDGRVNCAWPHNVPAGNKYLQTQFYGPIFVENISKFNTCYILSQVLVNLVICILRDVIFRNMLSRLNMKIFYIHWRLETFINIFCYSEVLNVSYLQMNLIVRTCLLLLKRSPSQIMQVKYSNLKYLTPNLNKNICWQVQ